MRTITGIPVSGGVGIGRVFLIDDHEPSRIPRREIAAADVDAEIERLDTARRRSIDELNQLHLDAQSEMGPEAAKIFLFHIGALNDDSLIGPMRGMIREERVGAEFAAATVFRRWVGLFEAKSDPTFQTKVSDLLDLSARVVAHLYGQRRETLRDVDGPTVVVARDLTPTQTVGFDRSKIRAIATDRGGKTSHTAIVARALNLPAVVGAVGLSNAAPDGATAIIDGDTGTIVLDPDEATLQRYARTILKREKYEAALTALADSPAVTRDGVPIAVQGNIEFPEEIDDILRNGGVGVGLYRTEFLYLTSRSSPTENQQYAAYRACVERLAGRPLTIRTSDLGADKHHDGMQVDERNPFLGLRSIRYCLKHQPMFRTQLRAILRASAHGPVQVMFPMITTAGEYRQARFLLHEVMEDLDDERIPFNRDLRVGIMIEVPAAALSATTFAREVDFFSIGTNDLVQYTLAVDRINETVASLYQPTHPAVLKLIRDTVRAARRFDVPVSCCGESAAEPEFAVILLGLGVRTLSMNAGSIPLIKRLIRGVTIETCERIAKRAIAFDSEVEATAYLRDRVRKIVPEAYGDWDPETPS